VKNRVVAFAFVALFVLAVSQTAFANEATLQFQGFTDGNSSFNGAAITSGTPFDIQIEFETSPFFSPIPGAALYPGIDDVQAEVGGTPYLVAPLSLADQYVVEFLDSSNEFDPGSFAAVFGVLSGPDNNLALIPFFTNASTPGWSATALTSTTFSGYESSVGSEIGFSTPGGPLLIDYDPIGADLNGGVSASLSVATPEPSAFSLAVLGLGVLVLMSRRRFAILGGR
jgi:uncharacterized protein (TIGR03382 family)